MGTCYSTHSRPINVSVSTADMPHDTSLTANVTEKSSLRPGSATQSHMFGFKKPYGGRYGKITNSNEQSSRAGSATDRSPLGMMTETTSKGSNTELNKPKGGHIDNAPRRFGFGFKPQNKKIADANRNPKKAISSESLNSNSSLSRKGSQNSQKKKGAYNPKDQHSSLESWRMIDDSSTAESMSSGGDKFNSRTENVKTMSEEDVKNANISPEDTPGSHKSGSSTSTLTDKKSTNGFKAPSSSKLQSRFRGPLAKFYASKSMDKPEKADTWVKASSSPATAATVKIGKPPPSQPKKSGGGVQNFLKRGLLRKQKSAPADAPKDSSLGVSDKKGQSRDTKTQGVNTANGQPQKEVEEEPVFAEVGQNNAKLPSRLNAGAQKLFDIPFGKAPIAMIDSIETTSIGSIGSDDLMLETDIPLEDYDELGPSEPNSRHQSTSDSTSVRPRQGSKPRSRSRSHSRDSLDGEKAIKPALVQRSISENKGLSRGDSFKKKSSKSVSLDVEQENEPLQELASLLEHNNCVPRRNPRHQRANRPASFPGWRTSMEGDGPPSLGGSIGGTPTTPTDGMKVFRPPKQPSLDDPDPVIVDSFTYRHLMQDMTNMKTMTLKLKRLLQEDELGTPIGGQPLSQSWGSKNGFKQLGGSQPGSPFYEDKRFSFSDKEATEPVSMEALKQENIELRHQMQMLQHQVEEQERTIRLLQQQMTKYECGHVGPGGTCFTHSATQTDKPRLPISKSVFESSSSRRVEASDARPVVSFSTRMGIEEMEETEVEGVLSVPSESESGIEGDPKDNILDDFPSDELLVHPLDSVDDVLESESDIALQEELVLGLNTNSNSGHYIEVLDGKDGEIIEENALSDRTDKDIETLADEDTGVLSPSSDILCDDLVKVDFSEVSDDLLGTSDTVTSVTDDLISSLTTPSSDGVMDICVPYSGFAESSIDYGIDTEQIPCVADLPNFPGELSTEHTAESTPVGAKGKVRTAGIGMLNVTFDAEEAGLCSIHDFNVQTEERLEHYVPKSIDCEIELAEREEEELSSSVTDSRDSSQQQATQDQRGEVNSSEVLQRTFTIEKTDQQNQTFTMSEDSLPADGTANGRNSTYTLPTSPTQPRETVADSKNMVRSETHSSGYQSDVMVTSTTSSDAMAASLTSADPIGYKNLSEELTVQTGCNQNSVNTDLSNGTLPANGKQNSKLSKPKISGLQRPKFQAQTIKNNSVVKEKDRSANLPPKDQRLSGAVNRSRNNVRPTSLTKKYNSSNSGVASKIKTVSPSTAEPPAETKSKMALPKAGKLARYSVGPCTASKLPAYGKQNASKPSLLKAPSSVKTKSKT